LTTQSQLIKTPDPFYPPHELRINDEAGTFRIIYRADTDAVVILEVWKKKTEQTPQSIIETCRRRLREYDQLNA